MYSCGTDLLCDVLIKIDESMTLIELNLFKVLLYLSVLYAFYYLGTRTKKPAYKEGFINAIQFYLKYVSNKKAGIDNRDSALFEKYIAEAKFRNAEFSEISPSNTFGNHLQMAAHFLDNGYKDAAAVIIGTTLENHIKELCEEFEVPLESDNGRPIRLDTLNASLASKEVYNRLDQKSITAWSGLRNDAAHGNYHQYSAEQVTLMLDGVGNFILRLPAKKFNMKHNEQEQALNDN